MSNPIIPVPSLGTQGWVFDSVNKFDLLISHFFLADYNQTYLYAGRVISAARLFEKNGSNMDGLLADLKSSLFDYLSAYYDRVDVTVTTANPLLTDPSSRVDIILKIGIGEQASQAVFGRLLESTNAKITNIIKLNNG